MLKNNGYFLCDLLISLSGWILIASVIVPMMIGLNKQSVELKEKSDAVHILYEYMQTVVVENPERTNFSVTKNDKEYEVVWQGKKDGVKSEVSIRYENVFGQTVQINEFLQ